MSLTAPATPRGTTGRRIRVAGRADSLVTTPLWASTSATGSGASTFLGPDRLDIAEVYGRVALDVSARGWRPAVAAASAAASGLKRYSLRIDGTGIKLRPLEPEHGADTAEMLFSHVSVADVVPVSPPNNRDGDDLRWLQVFCHCNGAAGADFSQDADSLAAAGVTLALPTNLDCMRVASALAHFQAPVDVVRSNATTKPDARHYSKTGAHAARTPGFGPKPSESPHQGCQT